MQREFNGRHLTYLASAAVALSVLAVGDARATEGYFQYGYGARQGALGGAGVADSRDAMAMSLNPAGIVDVGRQFQVGASLFAPFRSYTATGTGLIAQGSYDSSSNYFIVPNLAYTHPIDGNSAWGISMYGNGGMNTTWPNMARVNPCPPGTVGTGVYCGGPAGVDMMQAFISGDYARRFGAFSIGIAPTFVIQRFKGDGLSAFGAFGLSSDPAHLSDNGYSYSYGGGLRLGMEWRVAPNFRIGVAGSTPMWMTKFSKYSGLFAEGGGFNIPANITAGVAWDATPAVTVMVDYKRIFYSKIASIANPQAVPMPAGSLGLANGSGFGWHDVDVIKFGLEWRATPVWTYRVGYAHNTNPIKSTDVTFNILAPGVVTDHFTGGFAYQATPNSIFEFSAAYIPSHSVSGIELGPAGANPAGNINLEMHQYQFTLGYTYKFDTAPARKSALVTK